MRNKLLHLALLISFLTLGEGYSATVKQSSETESADQARPVPEQKVQPGRANRAPSLFVPTEKISADKDISFPTDI